MWKTEGNWDEMMGVVLGENGEGEEWLKKVEKLRSVGWERMEEREESEEGMNEDECMEYVRKRI